MTAKGTIVEGSVTDLTLNFLREHPGEWTLDKLAEALQRPKRLIYVSLELLCSSGRVHRSGKPARFVYVPPAMPFRTGHDAIADALLVCPLHAVRPLPRADPAPRCVLTGMPISAKNRFLVLSFENQLSARDRSIEIALRRTPSLAGRTRAARAGAKASWWRKRRAA